MTQSEQHVFLNGKFLPLSKANVSVLDRGFLLGDGIYEVIPVYSGKLFRLDQHLQRLDDSLKGVQITPPYNHEEWEKILMDLV
ncbi:MAG: aminotransferase class IV, partial [Gammaproteobacteria bacterium]|nr:aminotransferase class IV [Gammaproteobacteria bacterium]